MALALVIGWIGITPALADKSSVVTFDPVARFTGVRFQQGRVQLDADFNETVTLEISAVDQGFADMFLPLTTLVI